MNPFLYLLTERLPVSFHLFINTRFIGLFQYDIFAQGNSREIRRQKTERVKVSGLFHRNPYVVDDILSGALSST